MKVSGFTFVRDAVRLRYPIVSAIRSALPLVDEMVVNVGISGDGTVDLVRSMADACDQTLRRAGLTGADVDLLIPHQANIRIIEATAKHAGLPMDKVYVNVDRYGNTSAASIAIALDEAVRTGRLVPGMTVLLVAFGAGLTWASMAVKW
jgi:predicted naringenin-chalcone synthase